MKLFIIPFLLFSINSIAQTEKKFLYLQNETTQKIKKINLTSSSSLSYTRDSSDSDNNSFNYLTYTSSNPTLCNFTNAGVDFQYDSRYYFSDYYGDGNDQYHYELWDENSLSDSTINLPYSTATGNIDISLRRQSKLGRVMFGIGGFITYCAILNAVFVSPMVGLNDGSFKGYSFQRLWKGQLYSGAGLTIGVPLLLLFKERIYYFQSFDTDHDNWAVVDGKE